MSVSRFGHVEHFVTLFAQQIALGTAFLAVKVTVKFKFKVKVKVKV